MGVLSVLRLLSAKRPRFACGLFGRKQPEHFGLSYFTYYANMLIASYTKIVNIFFQTVIKMLVWKHLISRFGKQADNGPATAH